MPSSPEPSHPGQADKPGTSRLPSLPLEAIHPADTGLPGDVGGAAAAAGMADQVVLLHPAAMRPRIQLPQAPTALIGRDREVTACVALLRRAETRLLTLTGPAGVGKTRLALEVAARHAAEENEETVFVSLATLREPGLVLATIAQALHVPEDIGRSRLLALTERLRDRHLLLVLDNLEQVLGAASQLADLLAACPGLRILATSRAALRIRAEREYPVSPLPLPLQPLRPAEIAANPAVALFVERAAATDPFFGIDATNAADIAAICTRLDGLPLAIELAAARIGVLSPPAILSRLERRFTLLNDGPGDLPARQRTLRDAIAWSYDLLSPDEQILFRRLSVFAGGFSLSAAEAVSGGETVRGRGGENEASSPPHRLSPSPPEIDALRAVARLLGQSLVRRDETRDEPRFSMLETVRAFGLEQLAELGELDAIQARHADWCLDLVETAEPELLGPEQRRWYDLLALEHDNIRAAIDWTMSGDDSQRRIVGLRLTTSLWRFWSVRGHLREGGGRLQRAIELATTAPKELRAEALNNLGNVSYDLAEYANAKKWYEAALALRAELGNRLALGSSHSNLGLVAMVEGDYTGAITRFEESLKIRREFGSQQGISLALGNLGDAWLGLGEVDKAEACHRESLAILQVLGDTGGLGYSWYNLAEIARIRGDLGEARTLYERSLGIFREIDDRIGLDYALHGLGRVARRQGRRIDAANLLAEGLEIGRAVADRPGIVRCLEELAALAEPAQAELGVRLLGAAHTLRGSLAMASGANERQEREQLLAGLRAILPAGGFDRAWAAGVSEGDEAIAADATALVSAVIEAASAPVETAPHVETETGRRPAESGGLSDREIEVLRLVATGLTNAEVADRLFLSPRTVHAHLHRIYGKLGVSTRAAATRYAVERGLL